MTKAIGHKVWAISDGYIQPKSIGEAESHDGLCVLNSGDEGAHLNITIYFADREPMENVFSACGARRTNHIRLDKLKDDKGENVPVGVPYSLKVESDVPVLIQHTRVDTSQNAMALMTTMGFPVM
ncbi:MAG TPA: sensory rhodopsin transducer [Ruminiclostridium sp.]